MREVRAWVGCPPDAAPSRCRRPAVASATVTCPGRPNPRERSRPVARRRRHPRPRPSPPLALRNVSTSGATLPAHPRELSRPDLESHVARGRPFSTWRRVLSRSVFRCQVGPAGGLSCGPHTPGNGTWLAGSAIGDSVDRKSKFGATPRRNWITVVVASDGH